MPIAVAFGNLDTGVVDNDNAIVVINKIRQVDSDNTTCRSGAMPIIASNNMVASAAAIQVTPTAIATT